MFEKVFLNEFGFYELKNKPSNEDVKAYYKNLYYQESKGSYEKMYSEEEIEYFKNKLEQKYLLVKDAINFEDVVELKFLDIGCGEGWSLEFFKRLNWEVTGIDFSSYGCKLFNPGMIDYLIEGDMFIRIEELIKEEKKYDCIYLLNVLEHVLDPLKLLERCYQLLSEKGVLLIQAPNDFSKLQEYLLMTKKIDHNFWVCIPDHISYFNAQGLLNLCHHIGLKEINVLGDFPIDLNLVNMNTNYVLDKSKGKSCHKARVEIENLLHGISLQKANQIYEVLGEIGLGREIITLLRK